MEEILGERKGKRVSDTLFRGIRSSLICAPHSVHGFDVEIEASNGGSMSGHAAAAAN